jgi:rod shape-determining protein MreD
VTAQAAKAGAIVFSAAIVQVSVLNDVTLLAGTPDLLLVTLVGVAFICGSIPGAVLGFFAGLVIDTATMSTLGFTSLILTVAGYWTGRYGETTGRDKGHAPVLAVAVTTVLAAVGALGLRVVLGEHADEIAVLRSLPATVVWNVLLMAAVIRLLRRVLGRRAAAEPAQEVQLLG